MREKTKLKIMKIRQRRARIKVRFLTLAGILVGSSVLMAAPQNTNAESCPDLKIIFARGSGGERWENEDYLEFKARIEEKMPKLDGTYEFLDLDYPAVGVGLEHLSTTVGAYFGAGEAYEFGDSVQAGSKELARIVNGSGCKNTKYVLAGYSQGAMTVSRSLGDLDADKVIYVATFGDPKIYLPEGKGLIPAACFGQNLSEYRAYVPDCRAYEGLLGSYRPYQPEKYAGKLGTWCNKYDIFCSSHFSLDSHTSYISDDLYEDASRTIVSKIAEAFKIENVYTSPHDTAILIDSTGSMTWLIDSFKNEALRLANETFEKGGRVALYDYRDLGDPYEPVARCSFETCAAENFSSHLSGIAVDGGGDIPESLYSASLKVMNELEWQQGATKSLVVLTDAPALSPDRDGATLEDVVKLSKEIDPVNFYVITTEDVASSSREMNELAEKTDGSIVTDLGKLNLLTDQIMERYDTLPRVEEDTTEDTGALPEIKIISTIVDGGTVEINFENSGERVIVTLNDAVLGVSDKTSITIGELNREIKNEVILIPISDVRRGEGARVEIPIMIEDTETDNNASEDIKSMAENGDRAVEESIIVPKAPDTGMVKE